MDVVYDGARYGRGAVTWRLPRVLQSLAEKLPAVVAHLEENRADVLAFTAFPKEIWKQVWSNNPLSVNRPSGDISTAAA
jgi:putative transposase